MSELLERLAGRRVVASVSGGKDSAALSLHLTELGIPHDRVFLDTGWEHQSTYDYLRGPLTRAIGPILELRGERSMVQLIREKGMFPSRRARWCSEELKFKPLAAHFATLDTEPVDAVGVRAEESAARMQMAEWEWSNDLDAEVWRPLLRWTLADIIAIHQRHGLRPSPLYFQGAARVGCWPCIGARKAEVRLVGLDAERMQLLRELEAETSARRGAPRAWFQARNGRNEESGKRDGRPWSIDRAVEWANNGAAQEELFDGGEVGGCMRWGMCEAAK